MDVIDIPTFGPELTLGTAAVASAAGMPLVGRTRFLRAVLGTSARTWCSGAALAIVLLAVTVTYEAIFDQGSEYQFLGSAIVGWFTVMAWGAAGAVVVLSTPARRRWPAVEWCVHGAVCAALAAGVALWAWLAYAAVAMQDMS